VNELRQLYRQALVERIRTLEDARDRLADDGDAAQVIRRTAHSLRGSGGTYGFPEISTAATAVEQAGDADLRLTLHALITLLRATAADAD
jgi:HPt (histidine-containing phosphotransfer) domain-containing protein